MNGDWRELLYRLFDGEPLSDTEAEELRAALDDELRWSEASQWWRFEQTMAGQFAPLDDDLVNLSRERLLAKVILLEKSADMARAAAASQPANADSRPWWRRYAIIPSLGAIAATLAILATLWWPDVPRSYEQAALRGDFRLSQLHESAPRSTPSRGDRIAVGEHGAQLAIGGYCDIQLAPYTEATWRGEPFREVVELHRGSLQAHVVPERGSFRVLTPLGSIDVVGTEFRTTVEREETSAAERDRDDQGARVVVVVEVRTGIVSCRLPGPPIRLKAGDRRVFRAQGRPPGRTEGVVDRISEAVLTVISDERQVSFSIPRDNIIVRRNIAGLLPGDHIRVTWSDEDGRKWIRDLTGEGVVEGRVTRRGENWVELEVERGRRVEFRMPWREESSKAEPSRDVEMRERIDRLREGDLVRLKWFLLEGKRIRDLVPVNAERRGERERRQEDEGERSSGRRPPSDRPRDLKRDPRQE